MSTRTDLLAEQLLDRLVGDDDFDIDVRIVPSIEEMEPVHMTGTCGGSCGCPPWTHAGSTCQGSCPPSCGYSCDCGGGDGGGSGNCSGFFCFDWL